VVRDTEDLLPAPRNGNDLFHLQLDPTQERLPVGWRPISYAYFAKDENESKDLWTRFKANPNFGFAFDTGFLASGSDVRTIALGPSPEAGQTTFIGSDDWGQVPLTLLLDNQLRHIDLLGGEQLQLFIEANNFQRNDSLVAPQVFVRTFNGDNLTVGVGKAYSLFGTSGALPASLSPEVILIGAGELDDSDKRKQIRMQVNPTPGAAWGGGVAIEDPYDGDLDIPPTDVALTRWPTLASNLVYVGANQDNWIQLCGLVRSLGFEQDVTGAEFFQTCWGLSAYAQLATVIEPDHLEGLFCGVVGGDGVGQYIHGVSTSAIFDGTELASLKSVGAYAGYKQQWITANNSEFGTNLAYGYAHMESSAALDADANRKLQQGWANVLYYPIPNVAVGVEYQFGRRETQAAGDGENHRMMFVVGISSVASKTADVAYFASDASRVGEYGVAASAAAGGNASKQRF
jgi:hypothetical protein